MKKVTQLTARDLEAIKNIGKKDKQKVVAEEQLRHPYHLHEEGCDPRTPRHYRYHQTKGLTVIPNIRWIATKVFSPQLLVGQ